MNNIFHLKINSVTTVKFKTYIFRRGIHSKVGHKKIHKVLVGNRIHGTVILQWNAKLFESEANVPHVEHRGQA